jgi:hypothetical protein
MGLIRCWSLTRLGQLVHDVDSFEDGEFGGRRRRWEASHALNVN